MSRVVVIAAAVLIGGLDLVIVLRMVLRPGQPRVRVAAGAVSAAAVLMWLVVAFAFFDQSILGSAEATAVAVGLSPLIFLVVAVVLAFLLIVRDDGPRARDN